MKELKEYSHYHVTCMFCKEKELKSTIQVISAKLVRTGETIALSAILRAAGFEYAEQTYDEIIQCSSCKREFELQEFEVTGLRILVEEEYDREYQEGRRKFEREYEGEMKVNKNPSLGDYPDALVASRVGAFRTYEHEIPSLETFSRMLWFSRGYMQRWEEIVER